MNWIKQLFRAKEEQREIEPLERSLFAELESRLGPEAAAIYRKQISCYCLAYWFYRENVTRFGIKPPPELEAEVDGIGPPFPTDSEGVLATAVFGVQGESIRYTVLYEIHDGITASLRFEQAPSSTAWKSTSITIHEFTLHFDPMVSKRIRPEGRTSMQVDDLTGWLRDLAVRHHGQALQFPFNQAEVDARLANFDTAFPPELKEILRQTDGISFPERIDIFPMDEIYDVDMGKGGIYYIIGQFHPLCDPAYLMVKQGGKETTLYRGDMENARPVVLGNSLTGLLDDELSGR